jgi:hypothetical protein
MGSSNSRAQRFVVAGVVAVVAMLAVLRASAAHPGNPIHRPYGLSWSPDVARPNLTPFGSAAQAPECVRQQAPSTDCTCGPNKVVKKAACYITVKPLTGEKCGGPYCESCYVVCNRQ